MGQHANAYLLLFSHPFLVESLLRDFVPGAWVRDLDFATLEKVGGSYATDELSSRHDDVVWRLRSRRHGGDWIYVYLLLEFQSTDEHFMAVRVMAYVAVLYQDLIRLLKLEPGEPLPTVVPIVLYNGHARWKSPTETAALVPEVPAGLEEFRPQVRYLLLDEGAFEAEALAQLRNPVARLFRLERADPGEMLAELEALRENLAGPEHRELRRAFVICVLAILRRRLERVPLPELRELEEIEMMLAEKAPTWTEMWKQEGRKEGESKMLLRQLGQRFGALDAPTRRLVESADADRLLEWGDRILTAKRLETSSPTDVFQTWRAPSYPTTGI